MNKRFCLHSSRLTQVLFIVFVFFLSLPLSCRIQDRKDPVFIQLTPAAAKAVENCPDLVLGSYDLFLWDQNKSTLAVSVPFRRLLMLLAEMKTVESGEFQTLQDLNSVLQLAQGEGGLLRKPGLERWEIEDMPKWLEKRCEIESLLSEMGFMNSEAIEGKVSVDDCIIFGARAERAYERIQRTIERVKNARLKTRSFFLLGSSRPLVSHERFYLSKHLSSIVEENEKSYWSALLLSEAATESDALRFIWSFLVSQAGLIDLKEDVIFIRSSIIGRSYFDINGHRSTTEVSADDWLDFFQNGEQSIFAIVEQPYGRLADQFKMRVITNGKCAGTLSEINDRYMRTSFYFDRPMGKDEPQIGVYLDEIARHVYHTLDTIDYLNSIR